MKQMLRACGFLNCILVNIISVIFVKEIGVHSYLKVLKGKV